MRTLTALVASMILATAAVAAVSAASTPAASRATIDATVSLDGTVIGTMIADLAMPTNKDLSPGTYHFVGAPDNEIRASESVLGYIDFWRDDNHEGGSDVVYVEGVECLYYGPNASTCAHVRLMFVDIDDPTTPDQVVAFLPDGGELHFRVVAGKFRIDVAPIDY
jgi:hypothetical protein